MKRFLSLFLSLTLLAAGLCSCTPGGQGTDTTAEGTTAPPTGTVTDTPTEPQGIEPQNR